MTTSEGIQRFLDCSIETYRQRESKDVKSSCCPFVTISRETGAGGTTIGKLLAEHLNQESKKGCGWAVFDRNVVSTVLEEHGLPAKFAEYMPENTVSEIRDIMEEMVGLHPAQWTLVHKTAETLLHLAQLGHCVLVGRGGNMVSKKVAGGVHVRLVGSKDKRVAHVQEFYNMGHDEALKFIKAEDESRKDYLKSYYHADIDDPLIYDLILNTDHVSYQQAAKIIVELVTQKKLLGGKEHHHV